MKVRISEVWNLDAKSVELAVIETTRANAREDVFNWILKNRPELEMARGLSDHGFCASEIQ